MKQKLLKQLDNPYYINVCQYAPEYQPFYELKRKGWLWDSLIVWSTSLEDVWRSITLRYWRIVIIMNRFKEN